MKKKKKRQWVTNKQLWDAIGITESWKKMCRAVLKRNGWNEIEITDYIRMVMKNRNYKLDKFKPVDSLCEKCVLSVDPTNGPELIRVLKKAEAVIDTVIEQYVKGNDRLIKILMGEIDYEDL